MMVFLEIESLSKEEYTFIFSKLTNYENGMSFLLKLNFIKSITNNPRLYLSIDSNMIDNENLCQFVPSPASITIQLNNYQ